MRSRVVLLAGLALVAPAARAVVVAGGTGGEQTSNPGGGLPWNYVGTVGGGSGVFLGSYGGGLWVLTASHLVSSGSSLQNFGQGGNTYNFVPGSGVNVLNADNSPTDLTLFRISTGPALSNLALASAAPAFGSQVVMVGYGVRETTGTELFWNVTGSGVSTTWTPVTSSGPLNASGFATGNSGTERWGLNLTINPATQSPAFPSSYNVGTGATESVIVKFNPDLGIGVSQAGVGDSGGALFYDTGSGYQLAGILGAVGTFTNQPGNTSIFGQTTYAGSIAYYNSFIVSAIPEPANVAAWCGALAAGFVFWRRHRRA